MRFSTGVVAALVAPMALAFVQPSLTQKRVAFSTSAFDDSTRFSTEQKKAMTELQMAFDLNDGQVSNMFDGPTPLVKERDACGVGFIANTKSGGEFGTNKVLNEALVALDCMEHRGACGGDDESGDGAGIMTQIPWKLFDEYRSDDCAKPGVGFAFLPRDPERREAVKDIMKKVCEANEPDLSAGVKSLSIIQFSGLWLVMWYHLCGNSS